MDRNINLIKRLPPVLQNKMEYIEVCKVQEKEFVFLWNRINNVLKDQFLDELTLTGLKRWEKIMKITPKASETLEDRRFRIITRYLNKLPYTMTSLRSTLNTLCGQNGYKIEYDNLTYTLKIRLELSVKHQLNEVVRTLKYIIPTNIVQDISLLYNQNSVISKFTHAQLSKYTYTQLREDFLIKDKRRI